MKNNAPQVKLPPLWKIMSGCPKQTLHLSPIDVDGDNIRCRFSDENEAQVLLLIYNNIYQDNIRF